MTFYRPTKKLTALVDAFMTLNGEKEFAAFIRDLLTEAEIAEFAGRLAVSRALMEGKSQRVVAKETGISIATVTRVNKWLRRGTGGYQMVINRQKVKNSTDTDQHTVR